MENILLSCPSCGSNLEVTQDIERFTCGYCGKQLLVNRGRGIVSIKPLVEKWYIGIFRGRGDWWGLFWRFVPKQPPPLLPTTAIPRDPEKLESIGGAVDRTASELDIKRLKEEIIDVEASMKDANSSKSFLKRFLAIGIFGVFVGLYGFVFSANNPNTSAFLCGALPLVLSGVLLYYTYWADRAWNKEITSLQRKLNDKKGQLKLR